MDHEFTKSEIDKRISTLRTYKALLVNFHGWVFGAERNSRLHLHAKSIYAIERAAMKYMRESGYAGTWSFHENPQICRQNDYAGFVPEIGKSIEYYASLTPFRMTARIWLQKNQGLVTGLGIVVAILLFALGLYIRPRYMPNGPSLTSPQSRNTTAQHIVDMSIPRKPFDENKAAMPSYGNGSKSAPKIINAEGQASSVEYWSSTGRIPSSNSRNSSAEWSSKVQDAHCEPAEGPWYRDNVLKKEDNTNTAPNTLTSSGSLPATHLSAIPSQAAIPGDNKPSEARGVLVLTYDGQTGSRESLVEIKLIIALKNAHITSSSGWAGLSPAVVRALRDGRPSDATMKALRRIAKVVVVGEVDGFESRKTSTEDTGYDLGSVATYCCQPRLLVTLVDTDTGRCVSTDAVTPKGLSVETSPGGTLELAAADMAETWVKRNRHRL